MTLRFEIRLSDEADEHLNWFSKREKQLILGEVCRQLSYQPNIETKKRKKLKSSKLATWELRIEDFRVFYDIMTSEQAEPHVEIVAVGKKTHNVLKIAGEEVKP
ncbi:MAG: type II toxin-antitoxin system RelE/ParE family toxin [Planctomycetaceae bacterium]